MSTLVIPTGCLAKVSQIAPDCRLIDGATGVGRTLKLYVLVRVVAFPLIAQTEKVCVPTARFSAVNEGKATSRF